MKKYIVLFSFFSLSIPAHEPPVLLSKSIDRSVVGYGGYGYYYGSSQDIRSEAAANAIMKFSCTQAEKEKYKRLKELANQECDPLDLGLRRDLESEMLSIENKINEKLYEKIRQKTIEYFALNLAEATKNSNNPFQPSSLIDKCEVPADSMMGKALRGPENSNEAKRWKELRNYVGFSYRPARMGFAMIARERLLMFTGGRQEIGKRERLPGNANVTKEQFYRTIGYDRGRLPRTIDCREIYQFNNGSFGRSFEYLEEDDNYNLCIGMANELHRIETNYPNLYRWSVRRSREYGLGGFRSTKETRYAFDHYEYENGGQRKVFQPGIFSAMRDLLAANGDSWQSLWNSVKEKKDTKKLDKALKSAILKAITPSKTTPAITRAWNNYQSVANKANESYARSEKIFFLRTFCRKPKTNEDKRRFLQNIIASRPNVIRQFMLEEKPEDRALAKSLLCKNGYQSYIKDRNPCAGVTGGPLPGKRPVVVKQKTTNTYPFASYNGAIISQPTPQSPRSFSLGINFVLGPNMGGVPNATSLMNQAARKFEADSNKFLNCQVGAEGSPQSYSPPGANRAIPCPPDPKLKKPPGMNFNIKFNVAPPGSVPPKPKVSIHQCYRAEISWDHGVTAASNCQRVRQYAVNECIRAGKTATECDRITPPVGDPSLNRADSGNLTLNSKLGTLRHEVLHKLGLKDEYIDPGMPFNPIGEDNSIMRYSRHPNAKLYPRHLDELIAPTKCVKLRRRARERRRRGSR